MTALRATHAMTRRDETADWATGIRTVRAAQRAKQDRCAAQLGLIVGGW
jgi:hypothetical protein